MANLNPPKQHLIPFKPGQSGNPEGGRAHNQKLNMIRRMTKEDVAEIGQLILEGNLQRLRDIKDDPSATVLKVWFAAVAVKAINKGDAQALNVILDRIIGKVKAEVQLTGSLDTHSNMTAMEAEERLKVIKERIESRQDVIITTGSTLPDNK